MRFLLLFIYCFFSTQSFALSFQNEFKANQLAKVVSVRGQVVLGHNKGRLIDYPKVGDSIDQNIYISVRENSQIQLQIKNGGLLTLKAVSRVFISKNSRLNRLPVILFEGNISYKDPLKRPNLEVRLGSSGIKYWGDAFAIRLRGSEKEVVKEEGSILERSGAIEAVKMESNANVELIMDDSPLPEVEKKQKAIEQKPKGQMPTESSVDDFSDIFGESASQSITPAASTITSDSAAEFEDVFGDPIKPVEADVVVKGIEKPKGKRTSDFDFYLRNSTYLHAPTKESRHDKQIDHLDLRLNGKVKWSGVGNAVQTSFKVDISNREHVYRPLKDAFDFRNDKRFPIELTELYYLESSKSFDLTIGKKIVKLGKGIIYSPTDKISPRDQIVPVAPFTSGAFITQADFYSDQSTYTILAVPYFVGTRSPTSLSRWSLQNDGSDLTFETELPEKFYKQIQLLLKFESTIKGWDIFAALFNGPNPDPVIRKEISVINNRPEFKLFKEHAYTSFFSAGFSTVFGSLELHGEVLKSNTEQGKDDNYTQGMLGFRYTLDESVKWLGLDSIDIITEYAKEVIQQPQSRPFFVVSSINSRIYRDAVMGTFIFKFSDEFYLNYDYQFDYADKGQANVFGVSWHKKESGEWRLKIENFSGEKDSLFGKWDLNDNLAVEYFYTF